MPEHPSGESPAEIFSVLYISSATELFRDEDLAELLEVSRRNNQRSQITGMLLYQDGNFMQVIEGDEKRVRALQARIAADPRHHGVVTLLEETHPEREFPEWSMGFRDLGKPADEQPEGYSGFLNAPLNDPQFQVQPSAARKLLLSFKKSVLRHAT